jgi:hypothetical protein
VWLTCKFPTNLNPRVRRRIPLPTSDPFPQFAPGPILAVPCLEFGPAHEHDHAQVGALPEARPGRGHSLRRSRMGERPPPLAFTTSTSALTARVAHYDFHHEQDATPGNAQEVATAPTCPRMALRSRSGQPGPARRVTGAPRIGPADSAPEHAYNPARTDVDRRTSHPRSFTVDSGPRPTDAAAESTWCERCSTASNCSQRRRTSKDRWSRGLTVFRAPGRRAPDLLQYQCRRRE